MNNIYIKNGTASSVRWLLWVIELILSVIELDLGFVNAVVTFSASLQLTAVNSNFFVLSVGPWVLEEFLSVFLLSLNLLVVPALKGHRRTLLMFFPSVFLLIYRPRVWIRVYCQL